MKKDEKMAFLMFKSPSPCKCIKICSSLKVTVDLYYIQVSTVYGRGMLVSNKDDLAFPLWTCNSVRHCINMIKTLLT